MINKWILDNFKSVNEEKNLEFRPLTIFTGANSSGKSTVLQSILLVTQTLQDSIPSRSVVLNGWIKKFGSYTDIVNERDYSKDITIGFSFTDDSIDYMPSFLRRRLLVRDSEGNSSFTTTCQFSISSDGIEDNLNPSLVKTEVKLDASTLKDFIIYRESNKTEEEKLVIDSIGSEYDSKVFDYRIRTTDGKGLNFMGFNQKTIGVRLKHFLPNYLISYTTNKKRAKHFIEIYLRHGDRILDYKNDEEKAVASAIAKTALSIADNIIEGKKFRQGTGFEKKYQNLKKGKFTLPKFKSLFQASALNADEMKKFLDQLSTSIDNSKEIDEYFLPDEEPIFYYPSVGTVQEYFNENIKYLGPLREEPKSLYPLEGGTSSDDIGLKGENTAAVFQNNKTKEISYIDPEDFDSLKNGSAKTKKGTLAEAINKWLVYLGVASNMNTNDMGKIGHEMKIVTDLPQMEQDLTHVGVGVSQVLPILVMSFLAKPGDVILLEQPELHLHPKVQTRLADFFVSMNVLKKQCILETHSEYLINRLRYLVAISTNNKVAEDTMIYFVEKKNGHSEYRPVTINKYGVIEDWPDGFFDESEKIAADILRAGMEKKMKEDGQEYEE